MVLRIHFVEYVRYLEVLHFFSARLFLRVLFDGVALMLVVFAVVSSGRIKAIREAQRVPRPGIRVHQLFLVRRVHFGLGRRR